MNHAHCHGGFEPATNAPLAAAQDTFLLWAAEQEGRHELVGGKVVMMSPVNRAHAVLTVRIVAALFRQVDPDRFDVTGPDFGVRTQAGVRSPDVMVDLRSDQASRAAESPAFIGEVLSPSSIAIDMITKASEYTALPSLQLYVVFSQDEPRAWLWQRDENGSFPDKLTMIAGVEDVLFIPRLDAALPLGELYRGIGA
jgi:Uma2 family endonuclease